VRVARAGLATALALHGWVLTAGGTASADPPKRPPSAKGTAPAVHGSGGPSGGAPGASAGGGGGARPAHAGDALGSSSALEGTVEYTYALEDRRCVQAVCNLHTEERHAQGRFRLGGAAGDAPGAPTGDGVVTSDGGMENPRCRTHTRQTIRGPVTVTVAHDGTSTLEVTLGGDRWHGELEWSTTCGATPPRHETWDNGQFGTTCRFGPLDLVHGGTATADVPADAGHGTCRVTLVRR
jgi:hypothetical protein